MKKLFDSACSDVSSSDVLFDYCVSNPPYHIQTGGKNHQVYPEFWMSSWEFTGNSIMIFPIGWQKSTGRASGSAKHKDIRSDKHLIFVDNYHEEKDSPIKIFPGIGTGGVNIAQRDNSITSDVV